MKEFLTYKQANLLCRKNKIKDSFEYQKFRVTMYGMNKKQYQIHRRDRTKNVLPSEPQFYYKQWKSWYDFLGTEHHAIRFFMSYKDAIKWNKKNKIRTSGEYTKKRLRSLPGSPRLYYPEWNGWGEYLGTGVISTKFRKFRSYDDSSKCVIKNGIRSLKELKLWSKQGKKPVDVPSIPQIVYKNKGWKGSKKFFNTEFVSYDEAKEILKKYKITSREEFLRFIKQKQNRNLRIPMTPQVVYNMREK